MMKLTMSCETLSLKTTPCKTVSRNKIFWLLVVWGSVNLSGCHADDLNTSVHEPGFNGFWVSEAIGEALSVSPGSIKHYQYTDNYCVHSGTEVFTDERMYSVDGDQLTQYEFPDLTEGKDDYTHLFFRAGELPESCRMNPIDATMESGTEHPERDLEIFLQTFEQYYYSFDASGVDWSEIEQVARSQVSPQTSRAALFQVLSDAIAPLQNGHVGIADRGQVVSFKRADKPTIYDKFKAEYLTDNHLSPPLTELQQNAMTEYMMLNLNLTQAAITNYIDSSTIQSAANDNIIWGKLKQGNYGYLNVLGFTEFTDTADADQMMKIMHQSMQQAFADLGDTDGLVIDLRLNGGGSPFLARELAEYFVSQPTLGYRRSIRYGYQFSPEKEFFLYPELPFYGKPVSVLISNTTASAAEMAVLMLKESPVVTLIGENTQGMHSGNEQRVLPNGFIFSISNVRQLSASGESYEQRGIPPEFPAPFASKEDRISGTDAGLEVALTWLRTH